jgi:hypothetical protein
MDAERNRPKKYLNDLSAVAQKPEPDEMEKKFREMIKAGMPPPVLAEIVFEAIKKEKFYIFTHPEMKTLIQLRMKDIIDECHPLLPPMPGGNN